MADTDSLIVGFQTQLSDVMETVVKSAMYEVTRLVEDSLLPELKARGQEVIRLRLRLQTTEDQLREAQRTEARAEVTQEQEDNIQIHTDFIGGGHKMEDITSVDNSRCVSRSGPTQELDNTVASLHAVWIPQAILEDCGKLIDNIKKEPVEPTHCSSLNLDTWRVPPDEAPSKCQNASSRTEEPDNHNELLRNIVPQNMDPRISASYVISYEQHNTNNDATHSKALDNNTNWPDMPSVSETDCESKTSEKTSNKLESNARITPGSPTCNIFGVKIKQEVTGDSEQSQTHIVNNVNKAMSISFVRTGTPKQNRISQKHFMQVLKSKGNSSFRSNLLQRPFKRPSGLQTNCGSSSVSASHSQGPPSLSLSAQRAHVGNKHALNHSGSPWSKQTSNSLHTNASLNFNSNLDPKPIFRCGQCGKCFPHPSNLKSHLLTHTGERPFCCSLCGRTFTKLSNLKAHRRVHTGERPYSCVSCGKRFTQNCNLKRHQRIHLDV
ncbi:unnamed protein product [Knipowitschia caucasica]